ncbi:MAG: LPS assembly lipoprotein LptE [Gemmataceae bacterium]
MRLGCVLLAALVLLLPACSTDGHFTVGGYSSKPNYADNIRTIRVPMVKNRSGYTVTPVVGLEQDLHRALINEIETNTPYRVTQGEADTELTVVIRDVRKQLLNFTPFNTTRESELIVVVDVLWRDLRTGQVLSRVARRPGDREQRPETRQPLLADGLLPGVPRIGEVPERQGTGPQAVAPDEEAPPDPLANVVVTPVQLRTAAQFRQELGESTTTGLQKAIKQIARQITNAMESGW